MSLLLLSLVKGKSIYRLSRFFLLVAFEQQKFKINLRNSKNDVVEAVIKNLEVFERYKKFKWEEEEINEKMWKWYD